MNYITIPATRTSTNTYGMEPRRRYRCIYSFMAKAAMVMGGRFMFMVVGRRRLLFWPFC